MATINGSLGDDFIHVAGDGLVAPVGTTDLPLATSGGDSVTASSGNDFVAAGGGDDSVFGGSGNDTLFAGDGFDQLFGGANNDVLVGTGGSLNGVSGGTGADTLAGGDGNDSYYVALINSATIVEAAGEGIDTLYVSAYAAPPVLPGVPVVYPRLAVNVENLVISAPRGRLGETPVFFANDLDNTITSAPLAGGTRVGHVMHGLGGNDTYVVDSTNDETIEELGAGTDTVRSSVNWTLAANVENLALTASNLRGTGNALNNVITGSSGADTLNGLGGVDTLQGGTGADSYTVQDAGDVVIETGVNQPPSQRDVVNAFVSFTLGDFIEDLVVYGNSAGTGNGLANVITRSGAGNGTIAGEGGNDTLIGGTGRDTMFGGDGNDSLIGGDGNDSLDGGAENDRLEAGGGINILIGGNGDDTYVLVGADDILAETETGGIDTVESASNHSLRQWFENLTLTGAVGLFGAGNTLNNVITGTSGDDTLAGGNGNDTLFGGGGNDQLIGGIGVDSLVGGGGDDTYESVVGDTILELAGGGIDTVRTSVNHTLGDQVENLVLTGTTGRRGNGNSLANQLTGTDGNDTLDGRGNADTMTGGLGDDTYYRTAGDVVIEAADGGTDTVIAFSTYALAANVENLTLQSAALIGQTGLDGFGNELDNVIIGTAGIDRLYGGLGFDILYGGGSADTMAGGEGNDEYYITATQTVIEEYGNPEGGVDAVYSDLHLTVLAAFVENLRFTPTSAPIGGGAKATGNTQNNFMVNAGTRSDMEGLDGNDTLIGGAVEDTLRGGAGNDSLNGGTGVNKLFGGSGNDIYVVTDFSTEVSEIENFVDQGGTDLVRASVNHTLSLNVENLIITSSTGRQGSGNGQANQITGFTGNDTLYGFIGNDTLTGGGGNDVLYGGTDNDSMVGGTGDDSYFVDSAGDSVVEDPGAGTDSVYTSLAYTLGANVENLYMSNSIPISNAAGTGNALNNLLVRADGFGSLFGGIGNDTLVGAGGSDTLDGGSDADRMEGAGGDDRYLVDNPGDQVIEFLNSGTDWVFSSVNFTLADHVENLTLQGGVGLTGTGNALANRIEGTSFNDTIYGGQPFSGNDTFFGGGGNDTLTAGIDLRIEMYGGDGDDRVSFLAWDQNIILPSTPVLVLDGGIGRDVIDLTNVTRQSVVIDLAASTSNVAGLTFSGFEVVITGIGNDQISGATAADGGEGNDFIQGTAGNDVLIGSAGTDYLGTGGGADWLIGGTGDDLYELTGTDDLVFESASEGTDTIYVAASYVLGTTGGSANVENLVLLGGVGLTGTGNGLNNRIQGTIGNDTLSGSTGNDTLIGSSGADSISGGDGDDSILGGGSGNDTLTGGLNADTFVLNSNAAVSTITDFTSGTDRLAVTSVSLGIGNGDSVLNNAITSAGGGWTVANELVVFTTNLASLSAASAGLVAGVGVGPVAIGQKVVMAFDNGTSSQVYLFTSQNLDNVVSASELLLLADLQNAASTTVSDYFFQA